MDWDAESRIPKLNEERLQLSKEAKYLGIILDSKRFWKRNTEERKHDGLSN